MKVTFLQSSDPVNYAPLMMQSSQTVQAYCAMHGCDYHLSMGIRRGSKPWHAALNRIVILKEFSDRLYDGWIIYLDADAAIVDLNFDIREYLRQYGNTAIIAAPSGASPPRWWDVNNGVFAINLGHSRAVEFVNKWHERLMLVSIEDLNAETAWGQVADDQEMFHASIVDLHDFELFLSVDNHPHVFNWEGLFIAQMVRADGDFSERLSWVTEKAERAAAQYNIAGMASLY